MVYANNAIAEQTDCSWSTLLAIPSKSFGRISLGQNMFVRTLGLLEKIRRCQKLRISNFILEGKHGSSTTF